MKVLGVLVLALIAAWWIYIFKVKHTRPVETATAAATQPVVTIAPTPPDGPQVSFPESAKSDNQEVNNFVTGFVNVLIAGDYKNYRLKVTQRREPINLKMFEEAYGRVKTIEIAKIEKLDDPKVLKALKLDDAEPPVYRVEVRVVMRDNTQLDREISIFREQGHWVSSN